MTQPSCHVRLHVAKGGRGRSTIATDDHEVLDEARDAVSMSQNPQACPGFQEWVRHRHRNKAVAHGGEHKGKDVAHKQILGTREKARKRTYPHFRCLFPSSPPPLLPGRA
jgi:hypothetical protein